MFIEINTWTNDYDFRHCTEDAHYAPRCRVINTDQIIAITAYSWQNNHDTETLQGSWIHLTGEVMLLTDIAYEDFKALLDTICLTNKIDINTSPGI